MPDEQGLGATSQTSRPARGHALTAEDLTGASFTISSLGGIGFTPVVNRPQVAILGVSRSVVALDIAGGQEVVLPSTSAGEPAKAARDELSQVTVALGGGQRG